MFLKIDLEKLVMYVEWATATLKKRIIERNNSPRINACSSAERLQGVGEGLMGTWTVGTGCRTQEDPCKHATWVCTWTDGTGC